MKGFKAAIGALGLLCAASGGAHAQDLSAKAGGAHAQDLSAKECGAAAIAYPYAFKQLAALKESNAKALNACKGSQAQHCNDLRSEQNSKDSPQAYEAQLRAGHANATGQCVQHHITIPAAP